MAKKLSVTPKGILVYPHLNAPDFKFNAAGVYSTKLRLDAVEGEQFNARIDAFIERAVADAKADEKNRGKKIKPADSPCVQQEDGTYLVNFKMVASGVNKKTGETFKRVPTLIDGDMRPLSRDAKIGGGSIAKISFEPSTFYTSLIGAGVSLRLEGVQVIELREWDARSGESLGFSAEAAADAADSDTSGEEATVGASDGTDF